MDPRINQLMDGYYTLSLVKVGDFTLEEGTKTPVILSFRDLPGYKTLMIHTAQVLMPFAFDLRHDHLSNGNTPSLPLTIALGAQYGIPSQFLLLSRNNGSGGFETSNTYKEGQRVLVFVDTISTSGPLMERITFLRQINLVVEHVLTVMDYEIGAAKALREKGCKLTSMFTFRQLLDHGVHVGHITDALRQQAIEQVYPTG